VDYVLGTCRRIYSAPLFVGYAWKSNQYGLAFDTITEYELVKPDGSVVVVTEGSDSELFFGLKVIHLLILVVWLAHDGMYRVVLITSYGFRFGEKR